MAARRNPLRATPFAHFPAHSACIGTWKRRASRTSYLIHLSTAADSNRGNRSWVKIQSAGWVNIQSARTIITTVRRFSYISSGVGGRDGALVFGPGEKIDIPARVG